VSIYARRTDFGWPLKKISQHDKQGAREHSR
jgi:hypothetical protein